MPIPQAWTEVATVVLAFLLTYVLHSTVLLLAVALATRLVTSPEWRDVLWKAATVGGVATAALAALTVRLPVAPAPAWTIGGSAAAGVPAARSGLAQMDTLPTGATAPRSLRAPSAQTDTPLSSAASGPDRRSAGSAAATVVGGRNVGSSMRDALRAAAPVASAAAPAVVLAWLLFAGVGIARLARRRARLFALLADRRPVESGAAAAAFEAAAHAAGLRRRVRLTASAACPLPIAPTSGEVCVPKRFLVELDVEQQRGALAHEVAHLVRRDPAWVLALAAVEAIFFFQPLNRVARRRAKEAAEYLCDDAAARAGAGLGLARCLESVASWLQPSHGRALAVTSAMAEHRATLVHRVERLLTNGARRRVVHGGRAAAAAVVLLLAVATGAPAVTRAHTDGGSNRTANGTVPPHADRTPILQMDTALTAPRPALQETVLRAPDPTAPLEARWDWALDAAESRRARRFWIAYAFDRPTAADQVYLSDSDGVSFPEALSRDRPLQRVLGGGPSYDHGTIVLLFRFDGRTDGSIDRVAHRSITLGMDFGGLPVFWLGTAEDEESVPWLESLLEAVAVEKLADEVVDGLALHATSTIVLPALARILETHASEAVRSEAAEGLEYHDVPASLALARATATDDPSSVVRAEAAEAIGGIRTPGAAAALRDLVLGSRDPEVRAEAAEAFEEQPAEEALPALERIIMSGTDTRAESEAVEALAVFGDDALPLLRRAVWEHPASIVRAEAVETLGDIGSDGVLPLLEEVLERHPDRRVREEALDVLGEMDSPPARRLLRDAVRRRGSTFESGRLSIPLRSQR